jgi:hypothetical protein
MSISAGVSVGIVSKTGMSTSLNNSPSQPPMRQLPAVHRRIGHSRIRHNRWLSQDARWARTTVTVYPLGQPHAERGGVEVGDHLRSRSR